MNEEKKICGGGNPGLEGCLPDKNERELSPDEIEMVTGGRISYGVAVWDGVEERQLQADYAAYGAGMSLDDFIMSRGFSALEIECRNKWIRYGSRDDTSCVGNGRGVDAVRA